MKKTYVKPEVYFENFELSANIATGCTFRINHAEGACSAIPGVDGTIFTTTDVCRFTASENPDSGDKFCYHLPLDANRIFTS